MYTQNKRLIGLGAFGLYKQVQTRTQIKKGPGPSARMFGKLHLSLNPNDRNPS